MYGLTVEDWIRLYNAQEGRCILCHRSFGAKRLPNVDHNHATGEVRGLLCVWCNVAIGYMHEAADWFYAAWQYLTEPFARSVFKHTRRHRDAPPPEEPKA